MIETSLTGEFYCDQEVLSIARIAQLTTCCAIASMKITLTRGRALSTNEGCLIAREQRFGR